MFRVLLAALWGISAVPSLAAPAYDKEVSRPLWAQGAQGNQENIESEKIDLHYGGLSFLNTDLVLRGVAGLDVAVRRSYLATDSIGVSPFLGPWPMMPPEHGSTLGLGWQVLVAPIVRVNTYGQTEHYYPGADPICLGVLPSNSGSMSIASVMHSLHLPTGETKALHRSNKVVRAETDDGWVLSCKEGAYTLRSPNGVSYEMGDIWDVSVGPPAPTQNLMDYKHDMYLQAKKIIDRSGNWISIEYFTSTKRYKSSVLQDFSTSFRDPLRIDSSDGRTLDFVYEDLACPGVVHSVLKRVKGAGAEVSYESSCAPDGVHLVRVKNAAGNEWRYEYYPYVGVDPDRTIKRAASNLGDLTAARVWTPKSMEEVTFTSVEGRSNLLKTVYHPGGGAVSYDYVASAAESVWRLPVGYSCVGSNIEDIWSPKSVVGSWRQFIQVSKKTSSDGGVWEYKYAPGGSGQLDVTTVKGPGGTHVYKHYGSGYFVPSKWASKPQHEGLDNPYGCDSDAAFVLANLAGEGWRMGRLAEESIPALGYSVSYMWGGRKRADLENFTVATSRVPLVGDLADGKPINGLYRVPVYASDLLKKTIALDGVSYVSSFSDYDAYGNWGRFEEWVDAANGRVAVKKYGYDYENWIIGIPLGEEISVIKKP